MNNKTKMFTKTYFYFGYDKIMYFLLLTQKQYVCYTQ